MAQLGCYELSIQDFPDRILRHRLEFPDVDVLETVATQLVKADFPQAASLRFLRQVCRWGGYYGIAARVRKHNTPEAITAAFKTALGLLHKGDAASALRAINDLHSLRRPSFASKFLRFLAPQSASILDRVISHRTGIPLTPDGYEQLVRACQDVVTQLVEVGVPNPVRKNGEWFIADVEAAFYADMENFEA